MRQIEPATLKDLRARRHEIVRVAAEFGASNLRVFGSVARGEADEQSDVDLLVDLPARDAEGGFAYFGRLDDLRQALTRLLGRNVDVVTSGALSQAGFATRSEKRMRQRILAEAIPL